MWISSKSPPVLRTNEINRHPRTREPLTSSLLRSMLMLDVSANHWFSHMVPLTMKSRLLNNIISLILVFWLQKQMLPLPVSCLSPYWLWWWKGLIWCSAEVDIQVFWAAISFAFFLFGICRVIQQHYGRFRVLLLLTSLLVLLKEGKPFFC